MRLGVDIGGTFTDLALLGPDGSLVTGKVLSTPADYGDAVIAGIELLRARHGVAVDRVAEVTHASTVASNALLEGRGAAVALVTTEGFRDVLEMRRLRIPVLYDLQYERPEPLVPRHRRLEVRERLGPRGETWRVLDEGSVREVAARLAESDVEAIAIALLHAYADDRHERRVEEILRETVGDDVFVTRSADILPEPREYERTSTAVVNAYLGPVVGRYVASLAERLVALGVSAPLEIMQSSGGTLPPGTAARKPAHLVESGPAAGVIACARLGRLTGRTDLVSLDMGGTTTKAALLEDGEPVRTTEYEVGAGINLSSSLVKGGGHAVKLPFVDVSEIGAGGGSLVVVDAHGRLSVGPESAGASPGPVCYGTGGTRATLTDALVVLGYVDPESLAGGTIALDADAARRVIAAQVAAPLGLSPLAAARGVFSVAVATMVRAVKAVTTYRGRDPRAFTLCAFGGNGPVAGVELARSLGIATVLVPPFPGVFSAIGLLFGASERERVRTFLARTDEVESAAVDEALARLENEARGELADGHAAAAVHVRRFAELRFAGQAYELSVPLPGGPVSLAALVSGFVDEHVRTYGHGSPLDPVELVAVRVRAHVERSSGGTFDPLPQIVSDARRLGTRAAYFGSEHGTLETPVVTRGALADGEARGPLLVQEPDSSIVVPPGCTARLDRLGSVEVTVDRG